MQSPNELDQINPAFKKFVPNLRSHKSPFLEVVERNQPSDNFENHLIKAINHDAFESLRDIIKYYKCTPEGHAPMGSGVVAVIGNKGNGKTHLVHRLSRERVGVQITPPRYDSARDFLEQLLGRLTQTLIESQQAKDRVLEDLANWFTREALVEALDTMSPHKWLCYSSGKSTWRVIRDTLFPFFLGDTETKRKFVIKDLKDKVDIHIICREHGLPPSVLHRIARTHILEAEKGAGIQVEIRRALYLQLVDFAFTEDVKPLYDFLSDGFATIPSAKYVSRSELSVALFGAVTTLFRLSGRPVYVVYDALESFFLVNPDEKAREFFKGIAATIEDSNIVVPFFLFAERSYYLTTLNRSADAYVRQRLEQGINFCNSKKPHQIELKLKDWTQIQELVEQRMKHFLSVALDDVQITHDLSLGPFTSAQIRHAAMQSDGSTLYPLREIIQRLNQRYQQLIDPDTIVPPPLPPLHLALEQLWIEGLKSVQSRIANTSIKLLNESVHTSAERWLQHLASHNKSHGGGPEDLVSANSDVFGTHPQYGHQIRMTFRDGRTTSLAFLLGQKRGMRVDLEEKMNYLKQTPEASLRIIWPGGELSNKPEEVLPTATKEAWMKWVDDTIRNRVTLHPVPIESLALMLACEDFYREAIERIQGVDSTKIDRIVVDKTSELTTSLVQPLGSELKQ